MAGVRLIVGGIQQISDVVRFLDLAECLGIDLTSGHPVAIVGSNAELSVSIGLSEVSLPTDEPGEDDES